MWILLAPFPILGFYQEPICKDLCRLCNRTVHANIHWHKHILIPGTYCT